MTPTTPQEKIDLRLMIDHDIKKFLASGGKIQQVPIGQHTEFKRTSSGRVAPKLGRLSNRKNTYEVKA